MTAVEYVHVGAHADILASGRSVGPGDRVPNKELTDEDAHLIEEGHLVDVASFDQAPSNIDASQAPTKTELQAHAAELDIKGRSKMDADELAQAIADHEAEATATAGEES